MYGPDGPGATALNEFTEGNPQLGIPPTTVTANWLNRLNSEVLAPILAAGLSPNPLDSTQLLQALSILGPARRNVLINGAFQVSQRVPIEATPLVVVSGAAAYTADRWLLKPGDGSASHTVKRVVNVGGMILSEPFRWYYQWQCTVAPTSVRAQLINRTEDFLTLAGQAVVVSFWARVTSGTLVVDPRLRQFNEGSPSYDVVVDGASVTLTTTWQRFERTFTLTTPSVTPTFPSTTYLALELRPALQTFTLQLAGVQLERGTKATTFQHLPKASTLLECMRYFEVSGSPEDNVLEVGFYGAWDRESTDALTLNRTFRAYKRTIPTVTWLDAALLAGRIIVNGVSTVVTGSNNATSGQTGSPTYAGSPTTGDFKHRAAWRADAEFII